MLVKASSCVGQMPRFVSSSFQTASTSQIKLANCPFSHSISFHHFLLFPTQRAKKNTNTKDLILGDESDNEKQPDIPSQKIKMTYGLPSGNVDFMVN